MNVKQHLKRIGVGIVIMIASTLFFKALWAFFDYTVKHPKPAEVVFAVVLVYALGYGYEKWRKVGNY